MKGRAGLGSLSPRLTPNRLPATSIPAFVSRRIWSIGYNDAVVAKSIADAVRSLLALSGRAHRATCTIRPRSPHSLIAQDPHKAVQRLRDNSVPYIDQCGYDQAGIILQHIYGTLNAPNRGPLTGTIKRFDQSAYTWSDDPVPLSLGGSGYLFVPRACEEGAACRVHIALHGCKQDSGDIDRRYVDDTGYNAWADTNGLIVLYPQTVSSSYLPFNPEACWDWWSYVNHEDSYVTKSGPQIRTIKAMLDALTARAAPAVTPAPAVAAAPAALAVIDTSDTGADLARIPQPGTTAYRISRAGAPDQFDPVADVDRPSFADSGLTPASAYRWRVSALVNGVEGPTSEAAAATRAARAPCSQPGTCPVVK